MKLTTSLRSAAIRPDSRLLKDGDNSVPLGKTSARTCPAFEERLTALSRLRSLRLPASLGATHVAVNLQDTIYL